MIECWLVKFPRELGRSPQFKNRLEEIVQERNGK